MRPVAALAIVAVVAASGIAGYLVLTNTTSTTTVSPGQIQTINPGGAGGSPRRNPVLSKRGGNRDGLHNTNFHGPGPRGYDDFDHHDLLLPHDHDHRNNDCHFLYPSHEHGYDNGYSDYDDDLLRLNRDQLKLPHFRLDIDNNYDKHSEEVESMINSMESG